MTMIFFQPKNQRNEVVSTSVTTLNFNYFPKLSSMIRKLIQQMVSKRNQEIKLIWVEMNKSKMFHHQTNNLLPKDNTVINPMTLNNEFNNRRKVSKSKNMNIKSQIQNGSQTFLNILCATMIFKLSNLNFNRVMKKKMMIMKLSTKSKIKIYVMNPLSKRLSFRKTLFKDGKRLKIFSTEHM